MSFTPALIHEGRYRRRPTISRPDPAAADRRAALFNAWQTIEGLRTIMATGLAGLAAATDAPGSYTSCTLENCSPLDGNCVARNAARVQVNSTRQNLQTARWNYQICLDNARLNASRPEMIRPCSPPGEDPPCPDSLTSEATDRTATGYFGGGSQQISAQQTAALTAQYASNPAVAVALAAGNNAVATDPIFRALNNPTGAVYNPTSPTAAPPAASTPAPSSNPQSPAPAAGGGSTTTITGGTAAAQIVIDPATGRPTVEGAITEGGAADTTGAGIIQQITNWAEQPGNTPVAIAAAVALLWFVTRGR